MSEISTRPGKTCKLIVFTSDMNAMHIRRIDLNLIAVFDAVMEEGSLSAAGQRLGMTQSAVSHALARLRLMTGDELFLRTGRGMKPTPHALAIAGPLRSAVDLVRAAFEPRPSSKSYLEPDRCFSVDLPVGLDLVFVPPLLEAAKASGFGGRFAIASARAVDLLADLRLGDCDLALDLKPDWPPGFRSARLYDDAFMVCLRPDHPAAQDLSAESYLKAGHVTLRWTREAGSPVDDRLAHLGLGRSVTVAMPTLAGCAAVVAASDLLFTFHGRVAQRLARRFGLATLPVPVPLAPVTLHQVWHERLDRDPGHAWLRSTLATIAELL